MTDCILFQSVLNNNQPVQQLTNLKLDGFVTIPGYSLTDSGRLYGSYSYATGTYTLNLYKDSAKANLVATMTATSSGLASVVQANNSGISGTVNIVPGTVVNDSNIQVVCYLSEDDDIPLDNLSATSDYDTIFGFAKFHREAFNFIKNELTTRFESVLWNNAYIDVSQINNGTGGYDLSRILSWNSPDIREASAQYVLYLIARKQAIEPKGLFADRAKCAYERCVALLQSIEISFDVDTTRVPKKTRSTSTFKISRA